MTLSGIRKYLKDNPTAGMITIAVIIAASFSFLYIGFKSPPALQNTDLIYVYDLNTNELKTESFHTVLPRVFEEAENPESKRSRIVIAKVYGCGGCGSKHEMFISHLLIYNTKILHKIPHQMSDRAKMTMMAETPEGILISGYDNQAQKPTGQWMYQNSAEGGNLISTIMKNPPCKDSVRIMPCAPSIATN